MENTDTVADSSLTFFTNSLADSMTQHIMKYLIPSIINGAQQHKGFVLTEEELAEWCKIPYARPSINNIYSLPNQQMNSGSTSPVGQMFQNQGMQNQGFQGVQGGQNQIQNMQNQFQNGPSSPFNGNTLAPQPNYQDIEKAKQPRRCSWSTVKIPGHCERLGLRKDTLNKYCSLPITTPGSIYCNQCIKSDNNRKVKGKPGAMAPGVGGGMVGGGMMGGGMVGGGMMAGGGMMGGVQNGLPMNQMSMGQQGQGQQNNFMGQMGQMGQQNQMNQMTQQGSGQQNNFMGQMGQMGQGIQQNQQNQKAPQVTLTKRKPTNVNEENLYFDNRRFIVHYMDKGRMTAIGKEDPITKKDIIPLTEEDKIEAVKSGMQVQSFVIKSSGPIQSQDSVYSGVPSGPSIPSFPGSNSAESIPSYQGNNYQENQNQVNQTQISQPVSGQQNNPMTGVSSQNYTTPAQPYALPVDNSSSQNQVQNQSQIQGQTQNQNQSVYQSGYPSGFQANPSSFALPSSSSLPPLLPSSLPPSSASPSSFPLPLPSSPLPLPHVSYPLPNSSIPPPPLPLPSSSSLLPPLTPLASSMSSLSLSESSPAPSTG